jgi:hypothetical protein
MRKLCQQAPGLQVLYVIIASEDSPDALELIRQSSLGNIPSAAARRAREPHCRSRRLYCPVRRIGHPTVLAACRGVIGGYFSVENEIDLGICNCVRFPPETRCRSRRRAWTTLMGRDRLLPADY